MNTTITRPVAVDDAVKWTTRTNEGIETYTGRVIWVTPNEARVELHEDGSIVHVMIEDLEVLPVYSARNRVRSLRTGHVGYIHEDYHRATVTVLWDGWLHPVGVPRGEIVAVPFPTIAQRAADTAERDRATNGGAGYPVG